MFSDEDEIKQRIDWDKVIQGGAGLLGGLLGDSARPSEDIDQRIDWDKVIQGGAGVLGGLLGDLEVLRDILKDEGTYADAVASGKSHFALSILIDYRGIHCAISFV
jgi:hypothetical protein